MSVEIKVPALGESISEAVVAKWLKKPGDFVSLDEPILELETDKVTVSLPSPESGTLDSLVQEGTTVKIGQSVGVLTPGQKSKASGTPLATDKLSQEIKKVPPASLEQPKAINDTTSRPKTADIKTAPLSLTPSQRKSFHNGNLSETPSMETGNLTPMKPAQNTQQAKEEVVLMSPLRKKIAERLIEAQNSAAILTTFNEVDMSAIMGLRQKHQDSFTKKHGIKLGFMSFFSKAAVYALQSYPGLNAEIRGDQIVYKKRYDLGIAVGSGKGLVVPVVRGVDSLSLAGIEKEIARLAQKVKENTLTLEDLSGGTFTITNGGIYGSMMSTPILNMPQTGILGMHNIIKRPVCIDDKIEIRPMMYLALSYDHRVVDGREAVQFLVHVKELLESPEQLLLQS